MTRIKVSLKLPGPGWALWWWKVLETDILVRPNDFNTAMHGDTVSVAVKPNRDGKRMQGEWLRSD